MFQDEIYSPHGAQVFLSTLPVPTQSYNDVFLAYLADLNTYYDTGSSIVVVLVALLLKPDVSLILEIPVTMNQWQDPMHESIR